ncbi:BRO family protein [Mycobacterium sp. SMC-15]|uniref:BRO family protein n=1 Tax=Mycobacterium sp. SMC-15 TaxID=3381627 RepID=UPI003875BCA1
MTYLDDDERDSIINNDGIPGTPVRTVVNESGLYSLILRSRKPQAKRFNEAASWRFA